MSGHGELPINFCFGGQRLFTSSSVKIGASVSNYEEPNQWSLFQFGDKNFGINSSFIDEQISFTHPYLKIFGVPECKFIRF